MDLRWTDKPTSLNKVRLSSAAANQNAWSEIAPQSKNATQARASQIDWLYRLAAQCYFVGVGGQCDRFRKPTGA